MAHYKFADVLEGKGDENVLDNSDACGDLHRTRNQRLLAGRVLIPRNAVEASPSAYRAGGLGLSVCLRSRPFFADHRACHVRSDSFDWLLTAKKTWHCQTAIVISRPRGPSKPQAATAQSVAVLAV